MIIDNKIRFTTSISPSKDVTKGDHAKFFEAHRDTLPSVEKKVKDYRRFDNDEQTNL